MLLLQDTDTMHCVGEDDLIVWDDENSWKVTKLPLHFYSHDQAKFILSSCLNFRILGRMYWIKEHKHALYFFFLIYLSNTEPRLTHLCCYLSTPLLWQDECDSTWLLPFIKPRWITIWTDIICNGIQRYFIYTCGSIFIIKNMLWGTLHWHVLKTIWMLNLY